MRAAPALIAALALLASAAPLRAQPAGDAAGKAADADTHKQAARTHFDHARELHAAGKYLEAADEYLAAFAEVPLAAFVYDAAQVYRLAGDRARAVEHYRRYLELEPQGEGAADARAFIAELEGPRKEALGGDAGAPDDGGDAPLDRPLDPIGGGPARRDDAAPGRRLRIAAAVSAGVGVIGLVAAVGFGRKASGASDDLSHHQGPWTSEEDDLYRSGEDADRNMKISLAVGAAGLVTGGVLFYFGHRADERAETARVAAAPTAGGAMVMFGATF